MLSCLSAGLLPIAGIFSPFEKEMWEWAWLLQARHFCYLDSAHRGEKNPKLCSRTFWLIKHSPSFSLSPADVIHLLPKHLKDRVWRSWDSGLFTVPVEQNRQHTWNQHRVPDDTGTCWSRRNSDNCSVTELVHCCLTVHTLSTTSAEEEISTVFFCFLCSFFLANLTIRFIFLDINILCYF